MKKALKRAGVILLAALILFVLATFAVHRVRSAREAALLKAGGYYRPVSVGDHSLNVAVFGNENGAHTIVGLAGIGMGDFSLAARQMTAGLETDNRIVFVDRAGYGFSDDTDQDMTLELIVEDYRKALRNAGIDGPYLLMAHSIGGAYASDWVSRYPEEIEGVVFLDGSQLCADAFSEQEAYEVGAGDRLLALLAKMGFSRYVLRDYFYHYPDNYTVEEQALGDALILMTLDSIAPVSEDARLAENAQQAFASIVANEVPKLYICASWGMETEADLIENNRWVNRQLEINNLDFEPMPLEYDPQTLADLLALYEESRQNTILPYAEKMGNCTVVCLPGDHMIYEQKPAECAALIRDFLARLDG